MKFSYLRSSAFIGGSLLLLAAAGCTSDETESSMQTEQDRAMQDPFNYGPTADDLTAPGEDQLDRTNISGGGVGNYDRRAMKRDLDSILDP